jgi:hypothetical protein
MHHQRVYVMYYTLLDGNQHPVVQEYHQHYKEYMLCKAELESVHPLTWGTTIWCRPSWSVGSSLSSATGSDDSLC